MKMLLCLLLSAVLCVSALSGCFESGTSGGPAVGGSAGQTPEQGSPTKPEEPSDSEEQTNPEESTDPEETTKPTPEGGGTETAKPEETDPEEPSTGEEQTKPEGPTEPEEPDPAEAEEREKYSYRPQIFEELPRVSIDTEDGIDDFITRPRLEDKLNGSIDYTAATVRVDGPDGSTLSAPAQVKARGNYTLDYEKKAVRIKFGSKQNLLGLNEGRKFKSWVLLADYKDLSALNNATAFYLGKAILGSDGYYCSDFCTVEVYINGQYWGVYLLVEQQEAKEGRANAVEPDDGETGIDVGYLIEYDGYYENETAMPNGSGDPTFTVDYGGPLPRLNGGYYDPFQRGYTVKSDLQSDEQLTFLQNYVQNAFYILRTAVFQNKALRFNETYTGAEPAELTPQEAIERVVDVQSLADIYLLQEIACDPDIAWSSFYLTLDMRAGGANRLVFEAPWDYDSAFGSKWNTVNSGYGMYAAVSENPWLTVLIGTEFFQKLVKEKWEKLIKYSVLGTALSLVSEQTEAYRENFSENLQRWPNRLWGNDELTYEMNSFRTQAEAAARLSKWLSTRFNYLNGVLTGRGDALTGEELPTIPPPPDLPYVRFEAEACVFDGSMKWDNYFPYASGGAYLGQVEQGYNNGRLVTLTVYSNAETDAYLSIGLSKRSFAADFSDWFALFVNDARVWLPPCPIEACKDTEPEWGAWTQADLGYIHLNKGINTIKLNPIASAATNLDYFTLYCETEIS